MGDKNYFRVRLGRNDRFADLAYKEKFIGVDYGIGEALLSCQEIASFKNHFVTLYEKFNPGKKKASVAMACATCWKVSNIFKNGDIVICPKGGGKYLVGEISSDYYFAQGEELPHRRGVKWHARDIDKEQLSESFWRGVRVPPALVDISKYEEELRRIITEEKSIYSDNVEIEDPFSFALEKNLEDFLIQNWGKN